MPYWKTSDQNFIVMAKVTVLMAVYNASDYLNKSLGSLQRQTHRDFQAICIDDASTDDSLQILNDYAGCDSRFVVIHLEENSGQAHARNVGLAMASGDFVCMLDADDWLSDDALERAVACFNSEETDVVLFDVSIDHPDHSELYVIPSFQTLTGIEAFRLSLDWQIHGLYMVRTAIHRRFPYDETCRLYSDDNTTRLHYYNARRVAHCEGVYHYRQHTASSTKVVSVRQFDYLRANESMKQSLLALDVPVEMLAIYEQHRWLNLIGVYMFYFMHGRELSPQERRYGLSELKRIWQNIDRKLLNRSQNRKLGYLPMPTWPMFRLEEWVYFSLRRLLGKNR